MRAFLGLGSNLGDRWAYLRDAVASIPDKQAVSSVWETPAAGGPPQPPYLNCVVEMATDLSPYELLRLARGLEMAANRVRTVRNGPRTLDVDVLWCEGWELDDPELVVPHPRMWERPFVLAPLSELAPDMLRADQVEWAVSQARKVDGTL